MKKCRRIGLSLLLAGLLASPAVAIVSSVKVGDPAPDFALVDQHGRLIRLSDFKGRKAVVLAFYVKAFTPG